MTRARLLLFALAGFAAGLLALFPLSLALRLANAPQFGLSARAAQGSVWGGELRAARWRGVEIGDVRVALQAAPLFWGNPALELHSRGAVPLDGVVSLHGVRGLDAELPLRGLRASADGAIEGRARLENATAVFSGKRCRRAAGTVNLALRVRGRAGGWTSAPPLTGALQCRDGALVAPLRGGQEGLTVDVLARLSGDGAWRLDTKVNTANAGVVAALIASGFAPGPEGAVRSDEGRL